MNYGIQRIIFCLICFILAGCFNRPQCESVAMPSVYATSPIILEHELLLMNIPIDLPKMGYQVILNGDIVLNSCEVIVNSHAFLNGNLWMSLPDIYRLLILDIVSTQPVVADVEISDCAGQVLISEKAMEFTVDYIWINPGAPSSGCQVTMEDATIPYYSLTGSFEGPVEFGQP